MSTVPEAVVAKHAGIKTFGISLITDLLAMEHDLATATTHEDVLAIGQQRAEDLQRLVSAFVERIPL